MDTATTTLQIAPLAMGLLGGLAIFLFGMELLTDALKTVAGGGMQRILARLTSNRFGAALAGAFVTAVIQSSSVTTVLVVGFVSAGLMSLSQSVGVILGANIGTTVTAQIIAFKVTKYALVLIAIGFGTQFISRDDKVKCYGAMLLGLGLIFFGMDLMSNATRPLRSYAPFIELMGSMANPLLGIIVGAAFTAVVQSSSATTGVVIVLASQGFITLEAGIALAFGANVGTCVTAFLATAGKPREAMQTALVHVVFNVAGIIIWVGFIDQLADLVRWVSPAAEGLSGAAKLAAETPRQIANAHTCFNAVNTLIFLAFTGPLARLIEWLVPARRPADEEIAQPLYLDEILLDTPGLALDRVRMELGRLGEYVIRMMERALPAFTHGSRADLDRLTAMDDDVDALHGAIITYLGALSQQNASESQSERIYDYIATANYLENIGDTIETNLAEAGTERLRHNLQISEGTLEVLGRVHAKVRWSVHQALEAVVQDKGSVANEVIDAKDEINDLANEADTHLGQRLTAAAPNRLQAFRIESDVIENLKRIYYFAKRIAKVVAEADTASAKENQAA